MEDLTEVEQLDLTGFLDNLQTANNGQLSGTVDNNMSNDGVSDAHHSDEDENDDKDEAADETIVLPPHHRCAAHTLNLVGCNASSATAKTNAKYRSLLHSCNAKLSALWSKVNRPLSNEVISAMLGCQLVTPVTTRWNSYYDACRSLLLHSAEKLDALLKALQLPCFKEAELAFLKEGNRVLTPLAECLDRLQGDASPESYMAFLYPTLSVASSVYKTGY